ncbi:hypothetical protein LCGC14_1618680 [marine sediment metagenome]|uniref:BppU N-terminal domain-containing protein n=1 Tax=marine sediment metagenome TaxID=412755 RepID=A0A0F9I659_9ZZZZ
MANPSVYTNKSRLIFTGPCLVKTVHVAGDGAVGDCQVYDGQNANGELKAHIEVLSGTSYEWRPGDGTGFEQGIYIVVNASTTKVTVTFEPKARKGYIPE